MPTVLCWRAAGVRAMEAKVEEERERSGELEGEAAALRRTVVHKEEAMASMAARYVAAASLAPSLA